MTTARRTSRAQCHISALRLSVRYALFAGLFPGACCIACLVAPRLRQSDTPVTVSSIYKMNAGSRLILGACMIEGSRDPLLRQLHWLWAEQRFCSLTNKFTELLYENLNLAVDNTRTEIGVDLGTGCPRHSSVHRRWSLNSFRSLLPQFGTVYLITCQTHFSSIIPGETLDLYFLYAFLVM